MKANVQLENGYHSPIAVIRKDGYDVIANRTGNLRGHRVEVHTQKMYGNKATGMSNMDK